MQFRAEPEVDGIRALRQLLKVAPRRFGLKASDIREEAPAPTKQTIPDNSNDR
jgi:hypothetical protein